MGELGALFNPGMRHELEERRARAARREEEGNARDGDLRIDLDSGVAVINAPGDGDSDEGAVDAGSSRSPEATADDGARGDSIRAGGAPGSDPADVVADGSASSESGDRDAPDARADADPSAEPADAPLRPRGKRAMSSGRR